MKSILTFILLATILSASAQSNFSINAESQYSLGKAMVGLSFTLDEKPAQFKFGMYAEPSGTIHNQIELGVRIPHADRPTKNRVMLHVVGDGNLTPNAEYKNSMTLGVGIEYIVPTKLKNGDYLLWSIGADAYSDKSKKPLWPARAGELVWRPSVAVEYAFGGRYFFTDKNQ
jgi:opacity protein-like surface antigen